MAKTSIDIPQLRFNKMSTAKYEELKQAGQLVDNEFYITPDVSNSDIPAISSSTNDYVLSNDGNQLNWVQESEYTKNRIDSKLDENVITNCITKIPQDIKLELSEDGTLTLKADSKVYVPNGINSFNSLIVNSDINLTLSLQANTSYFLFATAGTDGLSINSVYRQTISNTISGSSIPQNGVFYDITNNKITAVTDGVQDSIFLSFPLCTFTTDTNGQITSIDQVFNGFGYIGSTIFALPGIEGFIPDGFNDDGSLNSIKFVTKNVLTKSRGLTGNLSLYIRSNDVSYSSGVYYNKEFNENRDIIDDAYNNYCLSGYLNADASGRIISFYPYKVIKFSNDQEVVHNTGDEEISGVKTFNDDIIAPNQLDYTNITNCITKIPQDIKLELSADGVLTLKAGSKVYVPNGVGKFDEIVIQNDKVYSSSSFSGSGQKFLFSGKDNFSWYGTSTQIFSGPEQPSNLSGEQPKLWYDLTANKIKLTSDNGISWEEHMISYPIAIINTSNNKITSIDQVFNGFGFMGNTWYVLPGVNVLIPNGFDSNKNYNNVNLTIPDIRIYTSTVDKSGYLTIQETNVVSDIIKEIQSREEAKENGHYYIINENKHYYYFNNMWIPILRASVGKITYNETGGVISFNPQNVFQAVSKNDKLWISSQGKPSNKYVDLSLNATGSSYTAPANGWVTFAKRANNANEYNSIHLEDHNCRWDCNATVANMWCSVSLPVKQNEKFIIEYTTSGELQRFRFIYDEGVK